MYWGQGWNMGWMMGWWGLIWILVLGAFVWLVARGVTGRSANHEDSPEVILKRRYARGELNRDEYEQRLTDLRK
jgi:putative membrane protein